ncbi:hypothetical protein KC19_6G175800 [Ceratodon purpureus]|uniref:TIR domain-containing protein n=1 Tax=Ceratodon purpureus TaxID=3225 RepID=A0A8T0HJ13_CERPU|nr:hypothetical protein KC19_6G175800 [Ceratodon purpureus]
MKRPRGSEDDGPDDIPESSRVRDVQHRSDGGMDDPILKPEHRIFLSHSGAQKDHFVEILCEDLERYNRFPFFDKRPASLPKGGSFPELIRTAIQDCQMAVVVVSDEFLMSEWPMIELDGFVQRRLKEEKQKSETMLKIVPLFYGLSLKDLENPENISKWYKQWEVFAKNDEGIDISSWKVSFGELIRFNGIEFKSRTTDLKVFREEIVKQICKEIPADVKWDDSHVQGGSKLCQVIEEAISRIQPSERYGVRVVGVYGVGGMGKTTLCNLLCNRFCEKSDVKSSHVELGSKSSGKLLKKVLKDLTNTDQDFVKGLDEGKCWNLLKNSCKQRIFLAIDNVWPDSKSLEEAKKYLNNLDFHEESVVIVTSRVEGTLTSLGVRKEDCFAMPSLEEEDATNLFLYHATSGNQALNDNDKQAIRECIRLCYFSKGKWNDRHYLPLALKALGLQLGNRFGKRPSEWVMALQDVRDFNHRQDKENPVFDILRTSFDSLRSTEQDLFMDLVRFSPNELFAVEEFYSEDSEEWDEVEQPLSSVLGLMGWLALVHNQSLENIGIRVQRLKERGLVEDVDMGAQEVYMHDLYREFANLEASGKLKDLDFEERKWAYYKDSNPTELLEMTPSPGCWQNLTRVGVVTDWVGNRPLSLEGIEWTNMSNVVVLKLCFNRWAAPFTGNLDLKGLRCLKSLELFNYSPRNTLDGLQDLKHLVYFKWHNTVESKEVFLRKLPASLKVLVLDGKKISLGSGVFDLCSNLAKLQLRNCGAGNLDFRNRPSLKHLELFRLHHVSEGVSKLSLDGLQDLRKLTVFRWKQFDDRNDPRDHYLGAVFSHRLQCQLPESLQVLEIVENVSLRSDVFARCTKLSEVYLRLCRAESLDLRNCTSLESLEIYELDERKDKSFVEITETSLYGLQGLRKLTVFRWKQSVDGRYYPRDHYWEELKGEFYHRLQCQLPESLQVLKIMENVSLRSDVFARCTKLSELKLRNCRAASLDLRNCKSVHIVELGRVKWLRTLSGLSSSAATLKTLKVYGCDSLDGISGLDQMVGLRILELRNLCVFGNPRLSDLGCLTNLEELHLDGSDVELGEEDVCVLASLPRLNPVGVGKGMSPTYVDGSSKFSVDVKRRKVLKRDRWWRWVERDLGELPVSCGTDEVWDTGDFAPP